MKHVATLLFLTFAIGITMAQTPFNLGVVEEIQSTELNEKRVLNIYLPQGYADSTQKKFPVIYLLDGSANEDFVHAVGLVQFLTMIGSMPQSIIVGIANVDRKRDFTFPTTIEKDKQAFPTTGGSAKFIEFLVKELMPFVQNKYRTASSTIIGQSLGGLLASQILIERPCMFDNYIIVSPSLWWDNESLLDKLTGNTDKYCSKNVVILVGKEGKQMVMGAKKLNNKLSGLTNHKVSYYYMPNEDHLTILHNALYKAFFY